jgi:hypothetical protein
MTVIRYRKIRDDEEKNCRNLSSEEGMVEAFTRGMQRILPSEQQAELRSGPDSRLCRAARYSRKECKIPECAQHRN